MSDDETKTMNKALFLNMVMMFSTSAMQQLGKIVNPATGKTGVDLQGAQFFIDLLLMLKAKTGNNLDRDEARLLNDTLATLQLNFVETSEEAERAAKKDEPPKGDASPAQPPEPVPSPTPEPQPKTKPDSKDPSYHKSYG
jgi:hypothetical protein